MRVGFCARFSLADASRAFSQRRVSVRSQFSSLLLFIFPSRGNSLPPGWNRGFASAVFQRTVFLLLFFPLPRPLPLPLSLSLFLSFLLSFFLSLCSSLSVRKCVKRAASGACGRLEIELLSLASDASSFPLRFTVREIRDRSVSCHNRIYRSFL